eukprot:9051203-Alexandrium_andersonii.AAC.1
MVPAVAGKRDEQHVVSPAHHLRFLAFMLASIVSQRPSATARTGKVPTRVFMRAHVFATSLPENLPWASFAE